MAAESSPLFLPGSALCKFPALHRTTFFTKFHNTLITTMAAQPASKFFGLDSDDSLRVSRWLELYSLDRETFYASFINWAISVANALRVAPSTVSAADKAIIESLRTLSLRPQVLMRNMSWYHTRKFLRSRKSPHEGPIRIADGGE